MWKCAGLTCETSIKNGGAEQVKQSNRCSQFGFQNLHLFTKLFCHLGLPHVGIYTKAHTRKPMAKSSVFSQDPGGGPASKIKTSSSSTISSFGFSATPILDLEDTAPWSGYPWMRRILEAMPKGDPEMGETWCGFTTKCSCCPSLLAKLQERYETYRHRCNNQSLWMFMVSWWQIHRAS